MTDAPKAPDGNHFPDFHDQGKIIEALKIAHGAMIVDLQLQVSNLKSAMKAQRAANYELLDWFNGRTPDDFAACRVRKALLKALDIT